MVKLLLVEDDEENRDSLARRLERHQFQVIMAVNGEEAVEKCLQEQPEVILMDLSLPGMTGWEATRRIRAQPMGKEVPIIALTAHLTAGDRDEAYEVGCNAFEPKPVDLPRLLKKIAQVMGNHTPQG